MTAADGTASIIINDECDAVSVQSENFADIWALALPAMKIIGQPGSKFRHAFQFYEVIPFPTQGILLHPALRF